MRGTHERSVGRDRSRHGAGGGSWHAGLHRGGRHPDLLWIPGAVVIEIDSRQRVIAGADRSAGADRRVGVAHPGGHASRNGGVRAEGAGDVHLGAAYLWSGVIHTGAIHTGAVQAGAVQAGAVQTGAVQTGAVGAGKVGAGAAGTRQGRTGLVTKSVACRSGDGGCSGWASAGGRGGDAARCHVGGNSGGGLCGVTAAAEGELLDLGGLERGKLRIGVTRSCLDGGSLGVVETQALHRVIELVDLGTHRGAGGGVLRRHRSGLALGTDLFPGVLLDLPDHRASAVQNVVGSVLLGFLVGVVVTGEELIDMAPEGPLGVDTLNRPCHVHVPRHVIARRGLGRRIG